MRDFTGTWFNKRKEEIVISPDPIAQSTKKEDHRLQSPTVIEKQAKEYPLKKETCKTLLSGACCSNNKE